VLPPICVSVLLDLGIGVFVGLGSAKTAASCQRQDRFLGRVFGSLLFGAVGGLAYYIISKVVTLEAYSGSFVVAFIGYICGAAIYNDMLGETATKTQVEASPRHEEPRR